MCFLWIFDNVLVNCSCAFLGSCVPVIEVGGDRERDRERGRVRVLVEVSSRRCVVRFRYLLFDDGPRPSEYGTCCGFGWFFLAIVAHVVLLGVRWGLGCCGDAAAGGAWLVVAADAPWLAWFWGAGSSIGGLFVLFLRRMKLATG